MKGKGQRIVVAMSGGVDSSVAAGLLVRAGYDVVGIFLRLGRYEARGGGRRQGCCSMEDAWDARRVAEVLGIPFYALDFEDAFTPILDEFVAAYGRGETPNPCVGCNRRVKVGRLLEYARGVGATEVATGHYARREDGPDGPRLLRGADEGKDQSYFLYALGEALLASCRFPLGGLTKAEVRRLAGEWGLAVSEKSESQEVCFVPDGDLRGWLAERLPSGLTPGRILDRDGNEVGRHDGFQRFTLGQRRGLGVAMGHPVYVEEIRPEEAVIVVGDGSRLARSEMEVGDLVWYGDPPIRPGRGEVQVRHRRPAAGAVWEVMEGGGVRVLFDRPESAVSPGQAAVFYSGDRVLGGGRIIPLRSRAPLL